MDTTTAVQINGKPEALTIEILEEAFEQIQKCKFYMKVIIYNPDDKDGVLKTLEGITQLKLPQQIHLLESVFRIKLFSLRLYPPGKIRIVDEDVFEALMKRIERTKFKYDFSKRLEIKK